MTTFREDLSKMLRYVRVARKLSQKEVADSLSINRSTYTYYEMAKIMPDIETLKKLSEIYCIPPESFFHPEKYAEKEIPMVRICHPRKA